MDTMCGVAALQTQLSWLLLHTVAAKPCVIAHVELHQLLCDDLIHIIQRVTLLRYMHNLCLLVAALRSLAS